MTGNHETSGRTRKSESKSVHVENVSKGAPIWCIGWLFTIGYAELSLGQGLLALLIWPVYLGDTLRTLGAG